MSAAPPLSITGVWQSLRWPTARDYVFSIKAYVAVVICLLIGFSQNLLNPYWSVLTVYIVLMQPESGAIRSKAYYRLIGTVGGGVLIMAMTGVLGDHLGLLLVADITVIAVSTWGRGIDRTPTNYIWFSGGLTAGFIGLVDLQRPDQIFTYSTARIAEISIGILVMAAVDSAFWPTHMKPDFLATMADWRERARDWVCTSLEDVDRRPPEPERRRKVRERLRKLTGTIGEIDAKAIQLPYDTVDKPPRRRDLHLVRLKVMQLIADLASIEEWARGLRRSEGASEHIRPLLDAVRAWTETSPDDPDLFVDPEAGSRLCERLEEASAAFADRVDRVALVEHGMIRRLLAFVEDWRDLALAMRSVRTLEKLPPRLRAIARDARPTRSIDYVAAARDVVPLIIAMTAAATIYYVTAWSSGAYAMLFAFIGCAFLNGQPQTLRSGAGVATWVSIAFAAVFAYQFAILPRVTGFPVLVAVFAPFLILVGLLLSMSLSGLFIAVFFFAFLSLQNVYSASFDTSLLSLAGSMSGLGLAIMSIYVCDYDKPHFIGRRIVRALRTDIVDAATVRRVPERARFTELTVDRLTQFFPQIESLDEDDPLVGIGMIDDMRIGLNILTLRGLEPRLPEAVRADLRDLIQAIADAFRHRAIGDALPDRLSDDVDAMIATGRTMDAGEPRFTLLIGLVGLQLAFSLDSAPFDDDSDPVDDPAAEDA